MRSAFTGFPPEALRFFRQLRRNNDREWFQPRKEQFEALVRAPMFQLVEEVNARLAKFAPQYVTEPKKSVYRIYRDIRFSANKTPYKDHIAASFGRRGREKDDFAGFYFSLNDKEIAVAGGVYHPPVETLRAIRNYIAEHYSDLEKILKSRKVRNAFGELHGEELSRAPKGFAPAHPADSPDPQERLAPLHSSRSGNRDDSSGAGRDRRALPAIASVSRVSQRRCAAEKDP